MVVLTIAEGAAGEMVTLVTVEAAAAAVPCRGTTTGLALALVMKLSVPLTVPLAVASKVTAKLWLCPGVRESGAVRPESAKPVPETCTWLTVRSALPVLLATTFCEPMTPTVLLTETLVGLTESCAAAAGGGVAGADGEEALLTVPAQPELVSATARVTRSNTKSGPRFLREEIMTWLSLFSLTELNCDLVALAAGARPSRLSAAVYRNNLAGTITRKGNARD